MSNYGEIVALPGEDGWFLKIPCRIGETVWGVFDTGYDGVCFDIDGGGKRCEYLEQGEDDWRCESDDCPYRWRVTKVGVTPGNMYWVAKEWGRRYFKDETGAKNMKKELEAGSKK